MLKKFGLKIEGKGTYTYHYIFRGENIENYFDEYLDALKKGQAIEVKIGREHRYIDYDEENDYRWRVKEIIYEIKLYGGV